MLSKLRPTFTSSRMSDPAWQELIPADLRTFAILTLFGVLFALEARCAYRKHSPSAVRQSSFTNIGVFILNDTLMSLLSVSSLWFVAEHYADSGLFGGISNRTGKAIGSFLLLDLVLYFWHRANHNHDTLWMFHKVHHSDRCMNVSTAFRSHGVEILLTTLVKTVFIVSVGVDAAVILANEAVITLFVMFHHANIAFHGERWLGQFIVVPYQHRVHHSAVRSEHDHNYAAVFSFWDRLFGTFADLEPLELGLANGVGLSLIDLVKFGLIPISFALPQRVRAMIAAAAYFLAEKRKCAPGHDFMNWLQAGKQISAAAPLPRERDFHLSRDLKILNPFSAVQRQRGGLFCKTTRHHFFAARCPVPKTLI